MIKFSANDFEVSSFEKGAKEYFQKLKSEKSADKTFYKSLEYSFFSGGKRLRPQLLISLGRVLGIKYRMLFPAAFALELIHTYSLIHDDLPAMDDDTYRRDKLTHHKKYGEASAVLAGDALLTLAFEVLGKSYKGEVARKLLVALAQSSGVNGMVGGQVLDCLTHERSRKIFNKIHHLKTAKLFEFAFSAPAIISEKSKDFSLKTKELGGQLGLLFQMQDDLFDEDKIGDRAEENILSVVSKEELKELIKTSSDKVRLSLSSLKLKEAVNESGFSKLIEKILKRDK